MGHSYRRACPECRLAGASLCTHRGPHGPQTVQPVSRGWLGGLLYSKDRLDDAPGSGARAVATTTGRQPAVFRRLAIAGAVLLAVALFLRHLLADAAGLLPVVVIGIFALAAIGIVRVAVVLRRTGLALVRWQEAPAPPQRIAIERTAPALPQRAAIEQPQPVAIERPRRLAIENRHVIPAYQDYEVREEVRR